MIRINIEITLSKILAYVVFIIGSVYSFYFQDSAVFIASMSAASAIIAVKTYTASQERKKLIEHPDYDGPEI